VNPGRFGELLRYLFEDLGWVRSPTVPVSFPMPDE